MSNIPPDSYFNCNMSFDGPSEPGDEQDYDRHNKDTFGDNLLNWEDDYEQTSPDVEGISIDDENNELSQRVASIILDDEGDDPLRPVRSNASDSTVPIWDVNRSNKVFTVEEVEAEMRREAEVQNDTVAVREQPTNAQSRGVVSRTPSIQRIPDNPAPRRYHHNEPYQPRYQPPYNEMRNYPRHLQTHPNQGMVRPPCAPLQRQLGPMMNHTPFYDPRQGHPGVRRQFTNAPPVNQQLQNNHHFKSFHPQNDGIPAFYNHQQRGYNMPTSAQPVDEYAGLMSSQEKQWLQSIQAMQLSGNQPLQDDYYYVMYNQNKQGNMSRKLGNYNVKNPREMSKPSSTYTPQQFENSLGKLQIGSVTAPRKIIDMEVVETPNIDANAKPPEKKSKQQLIEIEEMYPVLLEMEEACNPLFNRPNGPAREEDLAPHKERVLNFLLSDNKLISVMSIRKGKRLVCRLLPLLSNPAPIVHKLLLDLVPIARKDGAEQLLLTFLPAIRTYLGTANLSTLVEISQCYGSNFMLSTKFTTSVMANIVERAEQVFGMCEEEQVQEEWVRQLVKLAESTDQWVEENRAVIAIDRQLLVQHLMLIDKKVRSNQITVLLRAFGSLRHNNSPHVHT